MQNIVADNFPVGGTLPNGATIVAVTLLHEDEVVLLALWPRKYDPEYVSWRCPVSDPSATWAGYYSSSIKTAVEDYYRRGGRD